jgi:hypothetical protein
MTVDPTSNFEHLSFLTPRIARFAPVAGYRGQSDRSSAVKRAIWANTREIIAQASGSLVLIMQHDVCFTKQPNQVVSNISSAVDFMHKTPSADLFFLGYHPNARHARATIDAPISRLVYAIHWQAVIFRKASLDKLPERIPEAMHNDVFLQQLNGDGTLTFYGLRAPIAVQHCDRAIRWLEYGVWYQARASHRWGDPLPCTVVAILVIFVASLAATAAARNQQISL